MRMLVLVLSLLLSSSFSPVQSKAHSDSFEKSTCDALSHRSPKQSKRTNKVVAMLSPQDCWKHVGDYVTVKFLVDHTHACRKGHVYLNESKDYKTCFAAIIPAAGRKKFPVDTDKAYSGKTLEVTGTLEMYGGTPKIILDKPQQLLIVE